MKGRHFMSGKRHTTVRILALESRYNPSFLVTNTDDYKTPFSDLDPSTNPIPGSFRFAVDKATDYATQTGSPTTITFNTTPGVGLTDFSQPNTEIPLTFGTVKINNSVVIDAPKTHDNPAFDFVTIRNANTITTEPRGSVFEISIAHVNPNDPNVPDYGFSVDLRGIRITGGEVRGDGGGINAHGYFSLTIYSCEVVDNVTAYDPQGGATHGAGIFADGGTPGVILPVEQAFGPNISISNTLVSGNATHSNDNFPTKAYDVGGAMYLAAGCSLTLANSTIRHNFAEDGFGAIYFGGGQFDRPLNAQGLTSFFTTHLQIVDCAFIGNETKHGNSGALAINGPTGASIGATTFSGNTAGNNGGAVWLGGNGSIFGPGGPFLAPYLKYIGEVDFADCAFEGNVAAVKALDDEGQPIAVESGKGGGIYSDGVANRTYVYNSTFKGNYTEVGRGGAVAVVPAFVYFERWTQYLKSSAYALILDPDQNHDQPPGTVNDKRNTHFEVDNTTIAENIAHGLKNAGSGLTLC